MTSRNASIVIDLGFGDAGKGTIVDYLARQGGVSTVVRFNGGSQAAHNVVTSDGRHHTFSQFGSGMFVPGVRTHLSRHMLFDPEQVVIEAYELMKQGVRDPFSRLSVDEDALVVTPYHIVANVVREHLRGVHRDGTCGRGIGETMLHALTYPSDAIRVKDLRHPSRLMKKARRVQEHFYEVFKPSFDQVSGRMRTQYTNALCVPEFASRWARDTAESMKVLSVTSSEYLKTLSRGGNLIFEGAQGVLLDEWHGFHPHTTWSKTNADNALALLSEIEFGGAVEKIGVLRSYFTRHGEGPFPTEDPGLLVPELHNGETGHQGRFRRGWFDAVLAKYAIDATGGIDRLVMTHLDQLGMLADMTRHIQVGIGYDTEDPKKRLGIGNLVPYPRGGPLDYQTRHVSCISGRPHYLRVAHGSALEYAYAISGMLGARLGLVSSGPTAGDKIVL